jgi:hypothetical protein
MEIRELLIVLEQLRRLYGAGEAKPAEKDLAKIIEFLTPHAGDQIQAFFANLDTSEQRPGGEKTAPAKALNQTLVEDYATRLAAAGTDQSVFDQTFALLTGDAAVRLNEADAIARQFTRQQSAYKTKKAALTAIKQTFVERARFENKLLAVN